MSMKPRASGLQTRLLHATRELPANTAMVPPIYQTSTFMLPTPEDGAALAGEIAPTTLYTRCGSPNCSDVEALLAVLEGSEAALAVGSGMAAVTVAVLSNLQAGDHVVAQQTHYSDTLTLLRHTLPGFGIEVTQVPQGDTAAFAAAMRPNTRIVYMETPSNPTMELTDLRAVAAIAHASGALAICDNTFASSYNQRPLDLGCDMVVHSATKYLNGHSDVVAGAIMGSRSQIDTAWRYLRVHGAILHPFDAWLLRRGLQTYPLRMRIHNANGMQVARFLEEHPAVARVHYPGLVSHPQHALARQQMPGGFGGMVVFEMKGGYHAAYTVIRNTRLCTLAVSLGGMETLITHPASMIFAKVAPANMSEGSGLIRLSVGVENAEDIIADLDAALKLAQPPRAKRTKPAKVLLGSLSESVG